ncbi:MAG TPA: Mur ligase family protein, partial [Bacilli bacterium]|nr:Mur ligase family protein [Bacilli bacterium]
MFTNINDFIAWIESQKRTSPKVSLKKMRKYCEIIGNPQQNLRFIHIGGTNGKGSTVSYLKNILRDAGLNVGTFISPYVVCFNERIGYNEEYISDDELLHYGNLLLRYYPKFSEYGLENPTFFEALTLISFLFFASKKDIDVVILEVGLGGLLDSTNIIIPLVSVITNVSYDHMKILGNTLEEIALNKLGIAKTNVPLFTTYDERLANLF